MKKLILIGIALLSITAITAQSAEERGLQIANEADKADQGFKSSIVNLKMTLKKQKWS